jgi:hypothetical protein
MTSLPNFGGGNMKFTTYNTCESFSNAFVLCFPVFFFLTPPAKELHWDIDLSAPPQTSGAARESALTIPAAVTFPGCGFCLPSSANCWALFGVPYLQGNLETSPPSELCNHIADLVCFHPLKDYFIPELSLVSGWNGCPISFFFFFFNSHSRLEAPGWKQNSQKVILTVE